MAENAVANLGRLELGMGTTQLLWVSCGMSCFIRHLLSVHVVAKDGSSALSSHTFQAAPYLSGIVRVPALQLYGLKHVKCIRNACEWGFENSGSVLVCENL